MSRISSASDVGSEISQKKITLRAPEKTCKQIEDIKSYKKGVEKEFLTTTDVVIDSVDHWHASLFKKDAKEETLVTESEENENVSKGNEVGGMATILVELALELARVKAENAKLTTQNADLVEMNMQLTRRVLDLTK